MMKFGSTRTQFQILVGTININCTNTNTSSQTVNSIDT